MNALNPSRKVSNSKKMICIQLLNLVPYNIARVNGLRERGYKCQCLLDYKNDSFKPLNSLKHNLNTEIINSENLIIKTFKIINYFYKNNFDCVFISGYQETSSLASIIGAYLTNTKIVLFSESQEIDKKNRPIIKEIYKKIIINIFNGAVVGGDSHKKYLTKLGMKKESIFKGYDCVDNDYFLRKSSIRDSTIKDEIYLCCICRFVEKKNLLVLIKSFNSFKQKFIKHKNVKLKIAGTGPLLERLKLYIKENKIDYIEFVGAINYEDLPLFYSKSNGMILLSSTEQWGLVTNEALNCGIPVLISDKCGSKEIIKENVNGYIVKHNAIDKIALKIKNLIDLSQKKETKSQCRESIKEINPINFSIACTKAMNKKSNHNFLKFAAFLSIVILLGIKNLKFVGLQKFEA